MDNQDIFTRRLHYPKKKLPSQMMSEI